jgi:hypothetical protein
MYVSDSWVPFKAAVESLAIMIFLHFYSVIAHFCHSPSFVHKHTLLYSITVVIIYFWDQGLRLCQYISS